MLGAGPSTVAAAGGLRCSVGRCGGHTPQKCSSGTFLHTHTHPFCHRLTWQKSRWWKGNQACKEEAKKTGLFIASKISFAAKRSLKQKYQLAGWHPQPDFSFNHMAAQCQVSPSTHSFPPSAFQVLSVCSISSSLPWILGYNTLVLAIFIFFSQHFTFLITSTSVILISLGTCLSPLGNLCFFLASVPSPLCTLRRRINFIFFPLNNALTTCVNKLPLPFLRGPLSPSLPSPSVCTLKMSYLS